MRKLLIILAVAAIEVMAQVPPRTILWAWESPQNLKFLMKNREQTGVAFLSRTVILEGERVSVRPRMQPLRVAPRTYLVAVVRIEARKPVMSAEQQKQTVAALVEATEAKGVRELQIDFDAKRSEREFYSGVLRELRRQLPGERITITALASWCMGDSWIHGLPVDGAVPMLFRLGAERDLVRKKWASAEKDELCRESVGVSTDEQALGMGVRQVYWFHPGPWNEADVKAAVEEGKGR